jgi:hypothetical protein
MLTLTELEVFHAHNSVLTAAVLVQPYPRLISAKQPRAVNRNQSAKRNQQRL